MVVVQFELPISTEREVEQEEDKEENVVWGNFACPRSYFKTQLIRILEATGTSGK